VPWPDALTGDGEGWSALGFALFTLRRSDEVPDDVYYYGLVDPSESLEAYCAGPCLVGLTVRNDEPPGPGSVDLRLALGVGFPRVAADSAAHELGHAHGLRHAPCGPNLDAASVDADYPHAGGALGATGFDFTTGALVLSGEATDVMGYCGERWVSDYHFAKLLTRAAQVNERLTQGLSAQQAPVPHEVLSVDGAGHTRWSTVSMAPLREGRGATVRLEGAGGERLEADARWFTYDHLPGGFVAVASPAFRAVRAEVLLQGQRLSARR
jgi:hypothetical protein